MLLVSAFLIYLMLALGAVSDSPHCPVRGHTPHGYPLVPVEESSAYLTLKGAVETGLKPAIALDNFCR